MKINLGVITTIVLSLIPVALWAPSMVGNFNLRSASQISALVGTVLFSINFILSGRFAFLENYFNGLNRIYIIHHKIGQIALILLLFHPMFLGFYYLRLSISTTFAVLFPPIVSGFATWFGEFALITLVFLLILTLYIKLPYHIWKLTHKFLGLSLFFASIHIFFIDSTVSFNIPLRIFMLSVVGIGFATYVYRVILGRFFVNRREYTVSEINVLSDVTEIKMVASNKQPRPISQWFSHKSSKILFTALLQPLAKSTWFSQSLNKDGVIKYLPGQFVFVSFSSLGISSETHPFSLTSTPTDNFISLAAKSSGDYTETLKLLKVGSKAMVEGPFGRFSYKESPRVKQIWIAGGIGITPFVSMAKSLPKDNYDIKLYHSVGTKQETVFNSLLNGISSTNTNFSYKLIETKKTGRLTSDIITKEILDFKDRDIFICGPLPMMKNLRYQFNKLGIRNSHIFTEEFSLD